jgi:uncharacterized Tic20 family protein
MDQYNIQNNSQQEITDTDKLMAMFAHLSIFFGSLWIPLIFWAIYREKSKFVSFHSLQALFFHIAYIVVMVVLVMFVAIVGMLAGLFKKSGGAPVTPDALQIIVILALGVVVLGFIFGSIAYAVYLALNAYKGGMKKYPIVGNMVYKKLYS